jgi:hypothetical protein
MSHAPVPGTWPCPFPPASLWERARRLTRCPHLSAEDASRCEALGPDRSGQERA